MAPSQLDGWAHTTAMTTMTVANNIVGIRFIAIWLTLTANQNPPQFAGRNVPHRSHQTDVDTNESMTKICMQKMPRSAAFHQTYLFSESFGEPNPSAFSFLSSCNGNNNNRS